MPLHLSDNKITNNLEAILPTGSTDPTGSSVPALYTKDSGGNSELFFKDSDLNVLQITENGSLKDALTVSGSAEGDLLQFDGSAWQARGASGDPITGTPEFENLRVQSTLNTPELKVELTDVDATLALDATYGNNVLVLSVPTGAGAELVIELNEDPIPGTWDYDFNYGSFDGANKDLGSNTFPWKDGYFSGNLNVDGEVIAGTGTSILRGDRLTLKINSGLVGAGSGDIWIDNPSGLEEVLYYYDTPGGANRQVLSDNTFFLGDITGGYSALTVTKLYGIDVPSNPNGSDVLQKDAAGGWVAVGNASGSPLQGPFYVQELVVTGPNQDILWNIDGQGNIGASGVNRPNIIYAASAVVIGTGTTVIRGDGIDINGESPMIAPTGATNDILQLSGSTWYAKGAASGDPIVGALYTEDITLVGAKSVKWNTDGGGGIGGAGANRPANIYAKTLIDVAEGNVQANTAAGATTILKGDRLQHYVNTSTPASLTEGDSWYQSKRLRWQDTAGIRQVADGLHAKASGYTTKVNAGEVDLVEYIWSAGEMDVNNSILRLYILGRSTGTSNFTITIYYTENAGGAWDMLASYDSVSNIYSYCADFSLTQSPGSTSVCYLSWPACYGLNNNLPGVDNKNQPTNWFAGSGTNYGIKVAVENTTDARTTYWRGFIFEERTYS